jgi:lysophospholipase L1-like esterase
MNASEKSYVVVVWGDSIAAGIGEPGKAWPAQAEFIFNVAVNTGRSIKIHNEGVCGMPAAQARKEFQSRILPHQPDLVIIQFGFNDLRHDGSRGPLPISTPEEFEEHIERMVRDCRDTARAKVVLLGNHRARSMLEMPTGLTYDETRIRYKQGMAKVAGKMGVPYVDMEEELKGAGDWREIICEDGVHLSPPGLSAYACIGVNIIRKAMNNE